MFRTAMLKIGRLIGPAAVAASLIAAGAGTALAQPPLGQATAAVRITIGVHTRFPAVAGDRLVIYKATGYDTATISGTVTGTTSGATAMLLARPFRGNAFSPAGRPVTLRHKAPARYSFTVQPSVATAYEVRVSTGRAVTATSSARTVYVAGGGKLARPHQLCSPTSCTFSFPADLYIPAAAYSIETHKHWYLYIEVGYPKLPGYYTLSTTAKASKVHKVRSDEFQITFTFAVPLRHRHARWETNICTRNTERKDGIGLPGSFGCGDRLVSARDRYLG